MRGLAESAVGPAVDRRTRALAGLDALAAAGPTLAMTRLFGGAMVMVPMKAHFAMVATGGAAALAVALLLTVAGARRKDGRAVLIGTASFPATVFVAAARSTRSPPRRS